jgi:hypothetical protein
LDEAARISVTTGGVQSLLSNVSDQLAQLAVENSDDVREAESRKRTRVWKAATIRAKVQENEGNMDVLRATSALRGQAAAREHILAMRSALGEPPEVKRETRLDVIARGGKTSVMDDEDNSGPGSP